MAAYTREFVDKKESHLECAIHNFSYLLFPSDTNKRVVCSS